MSLHRHIHIYMSIYLSLSLSIYIYMYVYIYVGMYIRITYPPVYMTCVADTVVPDPYELQKPGIKR